MNVLNNIDLDSYGYHHPGKNAPSTRGLISPKANFHEVCVKLLNMDGIGIFVVDFDDNCRLIGCIGRTDLNKLNNETSFETLTAADIANKDCRVATLLTLEDDIPLLNKYHYMPVVDENYCFQFYVCDKSNWSKWSIDQEYELDYHQELFHNIYHKEGFPKKTIDKIIVNDENIKELIYKRLNGTILEIGAGPYFGYILYAKNALRRIIIEPLADKYADLRKEYNIEMPDSENIEIISQGGDIFIPELEKVADVIFCQNALDHTPDWPFVLANISLYCKKGGILYLGTDIDHHASKITGHYNISYNPDRLYGLLNALGFNIIYKNCYVRTIGNNFVAVVGIKR